MDANKKIGDYVASLDYSNDAFKEDICPPLISWLKEAGYSKEDGGIIVTTAGDIADDVIESMFNPNMEMLTDKADLLKHLNQEQYETLEQLIQINRKKASNVRYNLGEDEFLEVNFLNWLVKNVKTYLKKDGSIGTIEDILIDAAPSELIVYDNDILDEGRRFKITWKSKFSSREFVTQGETGSATIKEIGAILVNSGYCPQSKHITDTLSLMINAMIKNNLAIIKDTIDNKGVYYFNGKMQIVGLDTSKPEIKDIKKALRTLDKLQAQYDDEEKTILATVLKWGACCIFSYVKKQIGADWMPHLYLNGTGQAGKTTMGKLASFFYGGYTEEMNIGGGSFNSEYRIGFQVSRDCCLTIVNEPKACFSKEETIETVKNSVELPVCRKVQGKVYPALSPVVYTSNGFVPDMDSLYRRLYIIEFTHNQRKMGEEKTEFENMFNVEKPTKSILQNLNVLGKLCLRSVMKHPNLLEEDWKDMAAHFVNYWYEKADMVIPEWIMRWSDEADVTAVDEEIIESVREILSRTINDARKFNSDYASYNEEVTTSKDFLNMFWAMLNKRTFEWALPHSMHDKKLVFLTQGFKKLLKKEIPDLSTLKGISQLMNWDYKNLKVHGKTRRGILISCEDFLDFVYPTIEEIEE